MGKVDLDDEDDLLSKYQPKKQTIDSNEDEFTTSMKKFNSNMHTMIDSKWNAYKKSFHDDDNDNEQNEDDLYALPRQRTSSRSSSINPKITIVPPKQVSKEFFIRKKKIVVFFSLKLFRI